MERNDRLGARVRPADKKRWREAADAAGMSMSAWVEQHLNAAADKALNSPDQGQPLPADYWETAQ